MATYTWPSTGRHCPRDVAEHATRLKADFDFVSNTANVSLFDTTSLPSGLESRISQGITKAIAEACSNGYCPKWSEFEKSNFSKVMLRNITTEAALEARDRIPLPQFRGLHESYNALHTKIATQVPPTPTAHQFVGTDAATGATSVVDLVNAARKTRKETDLARTSKKLVIIGQEEKAKDVNGEESGHDTSEEEESNMGESEDAGEGQEVTESEDGEDAPCEDGSSDYWSGIGEESEEDREIASDAGSGADENQEIVRQKKVKRTSCGKGHRAGSNSCLAKAKARNSLGFQNETASQAIEAQATPSPRVLLSIWAARTQTETSMPSPVSQDANPAEDEIKSESDQSLLEADPTQDTHADTATLLKQIEDLEKIVAARNTALPTKSSGQIKRRAGEAFADGAEAESSNMAKKRIKQEQPTREDALGSYCQPSPYIVNRPH